MVPISSRILIASIACMDPMIPGSTPSTPASAHDGTLPAAGIEGNRQR